MACAFGFGGVLQDVVDAGADPSVRSGVSLLFFRERRGFPVAQALRFRNPLAQHDGREFLEALLLDAPLGRQGLQVDEAAVAERFDLTQGAQVAAHVGADFEYVFRFEQPHDGFVEAYFVEPEQVAYLRRGELQERYAEHHARTERGARLGVEAQQRLSHEVAARGGDVAFLFDDADLAPELDGGQGGRLVVADLCGEFVFSVVHARDKDTKNSRKNERIG